MAPISPSTEDAKKAPQDSGVFGGLLNTLGNAGEYIVDTAEDVVQAAPSVISKGLDVVTDATGIVGDIVGAGISIVKDTGKAVYNIAEDPTSIFIPKQVSKATSVAKHDSFAINKAKELNDLSGWDVAGGLLGMGKEFLFNKPKELLFGNDITNNLKVDKKDFDTKLGLLQSDINKINEKLSGVDKSKYNNFFSFNERTRQQYLKDKGLSDIKDEADYNFYLSQELKRLNGYDQSAIIREQEDYFKTIGSLEQELQSKQEGLRSYLNESINPTGDKSGEQIYNDYIKEQENKFKDDKYIAAISDIYNYSKEKVEDGLEAKGLAKVSDWSGYDKMKESIVDDIAAENQFYMSTLGMKDLPDNEKYANKLKEINDVSYKFKIDFANNFMNLRNNEEYKGLSEVDLKNKIQKLTWDNMSLEDKKIYKEKETIVTEISARKNYSQMKENFANWNPKFAIDAVSGVTSTIQSVIDNAYDFDNEDVPNFVKQDMRNIVYSGEGIGKNILSAIAYNPDALATIVAGNKGLGLLAKVPQQLATITKALQSTDKIIHAPIQIGKAVGTARFVSKSVNNLASSQLYGAVADTTLDNVMEEAHTKGIEGLNMISNLLFDTTPFLIKNAKTGIEESTTLNNIAYKYLDNPENKKAISDFTSAMKSKGLDVDTGTARAVLKNGVEGLYKTVFNPNEYKDLLTTPGKLYEFVGNQIKNMDESKVKEILTEKGIGLKLDRSIDGLTDENRYDINDAFDKSLENTVEGQFNKARLNNVLGVYKDMITPGKGGDISGMDIKIKSDAIKDENFQSLYKSSLKNLEEIKLATNKEDFNKAFESYNNNLKEIRKGYSNKKYEQSLTFKDPVTNNNINIRFSELEDLTGKNLLDIMKEGRVKITKAGHKQEGKVLSIRQQGEQNIEDVINNYLNKNKTIISNFEKELLLPVTKENGNDISGTIKKLFVGGNELLKLNWFGDLSKIENQDKMHKTIKFINDIIGELINTSGTYLKKEPLYINKELSNKLNSKTLMATGSDIRERMINDNSYLNLSYGYFKPENSDKDIFAMYIMPGKQMLKDSIINKAFNGLNNKGDTVVLNVLNSQSKDIVRNIITFGTTKDGIDFEKGLIKTKSIYSASDIDGLFIEGELSKDGIFKLVDNILGKRSDNNIKLFIYETIKGFNKSDSLILKPIIYNIVYNYSTNKELIDKILKSDSTKFNEIFSDLLLSPKMRDKISEKILGSRNVSDEFKVINNSLRAEVNKEWLIYKQRLNERINLLEDNKKQLETFLSSNLDINSRNSILKEISDIENRISAVSKDLKSEFKYTKTNLDKKIKSMYLDIIKSKLINTSGEILGTVKKVFNGNEITTLEDKIYKAKQLNKEALNGSDEFKEEVKRFLDVVKSDDSSYNKTFNYLEGLEDDRLKKYFNDLLDIKRNSTDEVYFIEDDIIYNDIKKDAIEGVLNHEWALQNNPLKKKLNAFLNNSSSGQDEILNEAIINHFDGVDVKNIDELFEKSESFKQFISDINLDNSKDIKNYAYKAVDIFRSKLKEIFKNEIVKTNKSENISDVLVDELIKDRRLFQKFKNLKNRIKLEQFTENCRINVKVSKGYGGYNELSFEKETYVDKVIQFENMKSHGVDFKLLNGLNSKTVKYLTIIQDKKKVKLTTIIKKYYDKLKLDNYKNEEGYLSSISQSPITAIKLFSDIFNGNIDNKLNDILSEDNQKSLLKQSGLDGLATDHIFVGGLGDKDSQMHLYRMPDEFINKVNKNDLKKSSLMIYNAEYAYANGYLKFDRELNTFEDFKKELLLNLKDGFTYKQLEEQFLKLSNKNLIDLDVIRKREASNASNFQTFGEHKEPVKLYVIDEVIDKDNELYKFKSNGNKLNNFLNKDGKVKQLNSKTKEEISLLNENELKEYLYDRLTLEEENNFINFISDFIKENNEISKRVKKELEADNSYHKIRTLINNTYANDLQDGTSFVSEYLTKLRGYLNGMNKYEVNSLEYRQFKDHFFGENEQTNGVRVFGKTLFNTSEIKEGGEVIDNGVAIGISSLKLGKDIYKNAKETIITIDGKEYKAKIIEGTDTSFFRNAASDVFEHGEEQTFSDSIKASLSDIANDRITELQKTQIAKAFNETLASLGDFSVNINSFSSVDKMVNDLVSRGGKGYSTSSVLGNKLNDFLSQVDTIINKPQDKGQSMFIRQSDTRIKTNEVIMHRDSQIVQQIQDEVANEEFGLKYKDLDKERKDFVNNNLFTIGYRYPVPSKYNIGAYKIRLNDEFPDYERMGTSQVVTHPETTYMKLEGDNDGDHIFFISSNTDMGKVIVNDLKGWLGTESELKSKVYNGLKDFDNDFIVIDQVEKISTDTAKTKEEYKDLLKSRLSAVEAKSYIGNVSATIRTIKLLALAMKGDLSQQIVKTTAEDDDLINFSFINTTLGELGRDYGFGKNIDIKDREFASNAAQLLQATLDFGNSGLDEFNPEWFMQLLNQAFPNLDNIQKYKIQDEIISTLSMGYKNNEFKSSSISSVNSALKKSKPSEKQLASLNKNLYGIIGDKRKLLEYLYSGKVINENGKEIVIGELISKLNKTQDLNWIINNVLKNSDNESVNKVIKIIKDDYSYKNYDFINDKLKANLTDIIIHDKNYIKDKSIFRDFTKYMKETNKKKKELLGKDIFKRISELDKDDRYALALYGLLNKEYKVINFATGDEVKEFLTYSDTKFLDRLDKEITEGFIKIPKTMSKAKQEEYLSGLKAELENRINQIKATADGDDVYVNNELSTLESKLSEVNTKYNYLNDLVLKEKKIIEDIKDEKPLTPSIQEYNIHGIDEQLIDIDSKGINVILSENEGFVNKTRNYLSGKVITFFQEYTPKLLADYNNLNDLLGVKKNYLPGSITDNILKASDNHILEFNEDFTKNKDSVIRQLKNSGIANYKDIGRKIQYELLDFKDGQYVLKDKENISNSIKKHLIDTNGEYLINDTKFIDSLISYQDLTIKAVVDVANQLESMGYKVSENYKGNERFSLVIDILEAHKANAQLALRLNGFLREEDFRRFVSGQLDRDGKSPLKGTVNTMIDVLYNTQGEWYDKVLGFLKNVHYSMTYGTMSLVTGNGIIAGLAQMTPNYVELRSYARKNMSDIKAGYDVIKRFGLLDSESVIEYGTSTMKDFESSGFLDNILNKALKNLGLPNVKRNNASALIHSIMTNPLGASDYPIENLRKMVATSNAMKTLGIKSADELERKILLYGKEYEGLFRSEVRKQYAESGGGVVSTSRLYRDTVFNHLHNYADIWGVRFFTQTMGYLMGWSLHKTATLIEKESTLYYGMKDLLKGNFKGAKTHLDDFFIFNGMIAHQLSMALGMYMKMAKYEKDTNDGVSFENFAKTFMNSVVSFQILVEKHINNWETSNELGGTFGENTGYTTVGMTRHMFRLFGQTNFIATMYKHYSYTQAEGNADVFNSLQFAMKEHYASYMRYNGIDNLENIYNSARQESKFALFGTGANTETEKMLKDLEDGKYFAIYKEKGFIRGMLDMFDGLLMKSATSVPVGLQSKISKDLVELVMKDKELSKLIRGGQFGKGEGNYDISNLLGKEGSILTADQVESVEEIYKNVGDYTYNYLQQSGVKKDTYTQSTIDRMLHTQIDDALKKEGLDMQTLIANSKNSAEFLKTLSVLETKYGLKNPLVISLMIENDYNNQLKDIKETEGRLTGEVSEYGTAYKEVTEEDKVKLKRDLLIKYQEYFNLNREIGMDVISQDIKINHRDKLEGIKNIIDKYGNAEKDMTQYLKSSYLIGQVAKEGDTSVSKLHSRYTLAAKGLKSDETSVKVANTFLKRLFDEEGLSYKEKLANGAAFLSGLDKATYGVLSNNEEFSKLTEDSRKVLMNWVFKINKDALSYDSNNLLHDLNNTAYGTSKGSYSNSNIRMLYPKYKSNSSGGARPGFSKQFAPMERFIKRNPQYISKDPDGFIRNYNKPAQGYETYNNNRSPIMREYKDLLIEQLFYGYKSKGIIKQSTYNKVDKEVKVNIKLKKAKPTKNLTQQKKFRAQPQIQRLRTNFEE